MLQNYLKIAWRKLRKNKVDSFISIGGLSVGLACCILLISYVRFEWSHDNFHENSDRIYRITEQSTNSRTGEIHRSVSTPYPLGAALDSTYPEIDKVINLGQMDIHYRLNDKFISQKVFLADPGFFEAFTFPLLYGNPQTALSEPDNIVITGKTAERLFDRKQVVGETINIRIRKDIYTYTVSAVAQTPPNNSSIQFKMVLPYESEFRSWDPKRVQRDRDNWYIGFGETWVTLKEDASPKELEAKFPALLKTHYGKFAEDRNKKMGLQPLDEAYFNQDYTSVITGNTNVIYSLILAGIAIVILAIAGINFMSLTLSRAVNKSHEIGIRKTVGAHRRQLSLQIMGEVFITCAISLLFGLALAEMSTPLFQVIADKPILLGIINQPVLWLALSAILVLLTLVTGSYPAFKFSRKRPTQLFSSQRTAQRIPLFVKGLVCIQFALTISFLIVTFVMQQQLNYLFNKDLGFSASNVISIELNLEGDQAKKTADLYSREARRIPGVQQASLTSGAYRVLPSQFRHYGFGMVSMRSATTLEGVGDGISSEAVDEHYLETMSIELLKGRNFSSERISEIKNGIIVNKHFTEAMGWKNPIGQVIKDDAETWQAPFDGKKVIGVIDNYHFQPLYDKLQPMALTHLQSRDNSNPQTILIKTANAKMGTTLQKLSSLGDEVIPEESFNYAFMNELVARQYEEEQRWSRIMKLASTMAIILACFGLFGLAALAAQRRTKEIGIRKVLGATVANIVGLLSKDFLKLVALGFIIAVPIAWYAMNQWLADFAYKIEIGPGIFLLAGGLALLIALATVSWQSIRAALANPVDSLRSE